MTAPTSTLNTCAAANDGPKMVIGIAASMVGRGSHTSKAGRGNTSGGVP